MEPLQTFASFRCAKTLGQVDLALSSTASSLGQSQNSGTHQLR